MIRSCLIRLTVVVCMALITFVPWSVGLAQEQNQLGQLPTTGWQTTKLSMAIVNDANRAMLNLVIAQQSNNLTADVVENAATSLQILSDHFQEIGLNAAIQNQLLNNQQAFLNLHPTNNQVGAYWSQLESNGVKVTLSQVRSAMDPGLESRQSFLALVQRGGIYNAELEAVAELRNQAKQIAASGPQSVRLTRQTGRLVFATAACNFCFIAAGIGLVTGCTVTIEFCGAALGPCGICALGG